MSTISANAPALGYPYPETFDPPSRSPSAMRRMIDDAPAKSGALRGSEQVAQAANQPITQEERKEFVKAVYLMVVRNLGLTKDGAFNGFQVFIGVGPKNMDSAARYVTRTDLKQAAIVINPANIDEFIGLHGQRRKNSLGEAGLAMAIANELFGIVHGANFPGKPGKDVVQVSQALELASNDASRRYLRKFHADVPELDQLMQLLSDNDAEITTPGDGSYDDRAPGTEAEESQAAQVLRLMKLSR